MAILLLAALATAAGAAAPARLTLEESDRLDREHQAVVLRVNAVLDRVEARRKTLVDEALRDDELAAWRADVESVFPDRDTAWTLNKAHLDGMKNLEIALMAGALVDAGRPGGEVRTVSPEYVRLTAAANAIDVRNKKMVLRIAEESERLNEAAARLSARHAHESRQRRAMAAGGAAVALIAALAFYVLRPPPRPKPRGPEIIRLG